MIHVAIVYKTGAHERIDCDGMRLDEDKVDFKGVTLDFVVTKEQPKGVKLETDFLSVELNTIDRIGVA